MELTVRVDVQYVAPPNATIKDILQMFRMPTWVRFMVRYISPHLKNSAPADKSVLESLDTWQHHATTSDTTDPSQQQVNDCVVCMSEIEQIEDSGDKCVELPCGHCFHQSCITSWLKFRSTCPTCRFQFRRAFSGSYAVKSLTSALMLREEHRNLTREEIMASSVGGEKINAAVNVTLRQVTVEHKNEQYPCVLNAKMLHANGDPLDKGFTATRPTPQEIQQPTTVPQHRKRSCPSSTEQETTCNKRIRAYKTKTRDY